MTELKLYTVKWSAKINGTDEVVARNDKDAKEIIIDKVKKMKLYDSDNGSIKIDNIEEEKSNIEIVKTP